ncbi:hypothetical protein DW721_06335 [Clostridium sp. AM27-31LB]|nr:hypothetical protein DW721_06335 [Clostridium sp. AM27-31LB]
MSPFLYYTYHIIKMQCFLLLLQTFVCFLYFHHNTRTNVCQHTFPHEVFTKSCWKHDKTVIFCGRKKDRIKAIYREKDGIVLLYKRLTGSGVDCSGQIC